MESQDLELAAEFCKLVGSPNLLVYLGLDDTADAGEARARLKSRRKFMQGMQGNPKYKKEALFLIKNFSNLNEVLGDPLTAMVDARRRAESEHLPIIEMTVRGVLAGGGLTADQEDYLRRNAVELGVSEDTFRELLKTVAAELGVPVKSLSDPTPAPPPPREIPLDLYQLLGISPTANADDIRIAHQRRLQELARVSDEEASGLRKRIEIAQKVLSNDSARRHYDLTAARTGPPARAREFRPDQAATAPPVRERQSGPEPARADTIEFGAGATPRAAGPGPRLEILGDPVRTIRLVRGMNTSTLILRNGGEGAMPGIAMLDVNWAAVDPARLDPSAREQTLSIQMDRGDVPDSATRLVLTIQTETGERARVAFELLRGPSTATVAAIAGVAIFAIVLLVVAIVQLL